MNMNIALLTASNPYDRRSWSGTVYHIMRALQEHCGEVTWIGPLNISMDLLLGKCMHKSSQLVLRKNFLYRHSLHVAKRYARIAATRLAKHPFDVIVAPNGATEIAFLQTSIPIILVEDAHFAVLHEYHQHFSNLLNRSQREAELLQERAIKRARLLLYPTEWAARSAVEYYHARHERVFVVPFGANLEHAPPREIIERKTRSERCRLLFVGVNWHRKGGAIAHQTLLKLIELGIPAELTVCGCKPPPGVSHRSMHVIPFLNKNDDRQCTLLEELYTQADFLLLPTRNECYGVAFCEAGAFGLPVITTNTGGVSGVVTNGENGFMLSHDADGVQYARLIARVYQDEALYQALVASSRNAFEQRLNWDSWGVTVKHLLERTI